MLPGRYFRFTRFVRRRGGRSQHDAYYILSSEKIRLFGCVGTRAESCIPSPSAKEANNSNCRRPRRYGATQDLSLQSGTFCNNRAGGPLVSAQALTARKTRNCRSPRRRGSGERFLPLRSDRGSGHLGSLPPRLDDRALRSQKHCGDRSVVSSADRCAIHEGCEDGSLFSFKCRT